MEYILNMHWVSNPDIVNIKLYFIINSHNDRGKSPRAL